MRVIDIVDVLFFLCVFSCWVFFLYVVFLIGVRAFFNFFGFIVLFLVWDWEGEGFLFRILGFWLFDTYSMMVLSWEDSGDWRWCLEETDIEFCILLRLFMLRGNFFFGDFRSFVWRIWIWIGLGRWWRCIDWYCLRIESLGN